MGESSVTFKDGSTYDFDLFFPPPRRYGEIKVALSMSGGVESTLLAYILASRYGANNVTVFSGQYEGRRSWESTHPAFICKQLGIEKHIPVPQSNHFMTPNDNWMMFVQSKQLYGFDLWFNGTNAKLFSGRNVVYQDTVERIKAQGYLVPFVWLEKWQTIELYYLLKQPYLLQLAHSCTEQPPEQGHCGKCYCCHERAWGFHTLGKTDPTTYAMPTSHVVREAEKYLEEDLYDRQRAGTASLL